MMNYYIKTLRSNLDNILSSESISPYSYYLSRGYGYNHFERLKSDVNDNLLRIDTRIIDDDEDVIYIEFNSYNWQLNALAPKRFEDYFFVAQPVYLFPWSCRILFKNADDARSSVFICRSSLTNKMWNYYSVGLAEKRESGVLPHLKPGNEIRTSIKVDIENDIVRNRIKGFLYTYYGGVYKSLKPETAKLLQYELKIYGLSVVMAGMRTPSQELINEMERLKKQFNTFDPNRVVLKNLWRERVINLFSTQIDGQLFENLLNRLGVQKAAMDAFAKEQGVVASPRLDMANLMGMNWRLFGVQLDEYTRLIIDQEIRERQISSEEHVKVEGSRIYFSRNDETLYEAVLNEVISGNKWLEPERVGSKKMDVANELAYFVKTYHERNGIQWEGSAEQNYLDGLRKNIAFSEPFDPNQTTNKGLRALAIYILKGDMFDEMFKYIQLSGVEDYSIVFGLWGANVGYANLPKTFMQKLALPQQKLDCCYSLSYSSMTGQIAPEELNSENFTEGIQRMPVSIVVKKKAPEEQSIINRLKQAPVKLTDEQTTCVQEILNKNNGRIDEKGFKEIAKIKGIGKKKLEQIKEILKDLVLTPKENLLFSDSYQYTQPRSLMPSDVMKVIQCCLPDDENVWKQVEKDVTWYMSGSHDSADRLIPRMCEYLYRNKNARGGRSWVRKLYENVDVSLIERKLREAYLM